VLTRKYAHFIFSSEIIHEMVCVASSIVFSKSEKVALFHVCHCHVLIDLFSLFLVSHLYNQLILFFWNSYQNFAKSRMWETL